MKSANLDADELPFIDVGAEAILQIRAASLSDDDRLIRFLTQRPGSSKIRKQLAT